MEWLLKRVNMLSHSYLLLVLVGSAGECQPENAGGSELRGYDALISDLGRF